MRIQIVSFNDNYIYFIRGYNQNIYIEQRLIQSSPSTFHSSILFFVQSFIEEVLLKSDEPRNMDPKAYGPYTIQQVYPNGTIDVAGVGVSGYYKSETWYVMCT